MAFPAVPERGAGPRAPSTAFAGLALCLVVALPAWAGEGRREIDQTCAVVTGCFSGDLPGFPVTIDGSAGHSYLITSNLSVADPNLDGVSISASAVSLDLGGFSVEGPVVCIGTGATVSCGAGAGVGIHAFAIGGIAVTNGRVRGFGSGGVQLGEAARVENIIAEANGGDGIEAQSGSLLRNLTTTANGDEGIYISGAGVLVSSTAFGNRGNGVSVDAGSVVSRNASRENGVRGIRSGSGTLIRENSTSGNGSHGIYAELYPLIADNTSFENARDGIFVFASACLQRNNSSSNGSVGVNGPPVTGKVQLWDNTIEDNALGTSTTPINFTGNICDGSFICP